MRHDLLELEIELRARSKESTNDLIRYVLFELQSPIEDYALAIELLKTNYSKSKDLRVAILGAYLSSSRQNYEENAFLEYLSEHLACTNAQSKAIIYYLLAYDIYVKCDGNFPEKYRVYLQHSIDYSEYFVYNYIRLAEISNKRDARILMKKAAANVRKVWSEKQIKEMPFESFIEYENYVNEFITGVEMSSIEYNAVLSRYVCLGSWQKISIQKSKANRWFMGK